MTGRGANSCYGFAVYKIQRSRGAGGIPRDSQDLKSQVVNWLSQN